MSDSWITFGLLLSRAKEQAGRSLMILDDADGEGCLWLGADADERRHLLAPVPTDFVFTPMKGAAIELTTWCDPRTDQKFLDLACEANALGKVFSRLADDVRERMRTTEQAAHVAMLTTLDDWKRLVRPARSLTEESARGLFGELLVAARLAKWNPHFAVESWTGPDGEAHDFTTSKGDLEVKTSKSSGQLVTISSLEQLDRPAGNPLVLIRQHVRASPNGRNITNMVEELVALGCSEAAVGEKLAEAGFLLGVDEDAHRFVEVSGPLSWRVENDFPGLRSQDLPSHRAAAITKVSYTLDLMGAPGAMDPGELDAFMGEMMTA